MHLIFDRIIKYILWFVFFVILSSFLYGFAKFDFSVPKYIQYLNNIQVNQLFSPNDIQNTSGTVLSGDVVELSGTDVYDSDLSDDVFGNTGFQSSGLNTSGSIDDESYGFVKNLETTGSKIADSSEARMVSSGSDDGLTGDSKEQLKNLILHEK